MPLISTPPPFQSATTTPKMGIQKMSSSIQSNLHSFHNQRSTPAVIEITFLMTRPFHLTLENWEPQPPSELPFSNVPTHPFLTLRMLYPVQWRHHLFS